MTQTPKPPMPTPEELEKMMVVPKWLVSAMVLLLQVLIYGVPAALVAVPLLYGPSGWFAIGWAVLMPMAYAFLFAITAGLLSLPWQKAIVKGVFPRDARFPVYAMRKLYGTCWTSVIYFKQVYGLVLSFGLLKRITFRLFGYRGHMNMNIAPDAWLRDLPLLRIEEDAYIANRATIGTNICLPDGNIIIGNVTLLKGAMVGHLSMLGVGVTLGEYSEVGVGCMVGLKSVIGNRSSIDPGCIISHRVRIGNNTKIGAGSFIGNEAVIGDGLIVPPDTTIPEKAVVNTQEDVMRHVRTLPSNETSPLAETGAVDS